jgi:hypothetical protein
MAPVLPQFRAAVPVGDDPYPVTPEGTGTVTVRHAF